MKRLGLRVNVKDSTDQLHNLAVQGPNSRDIMRELVWTPPTQPPLDELKWFRFLIGRIGGYDGIPIVVSRTGYTGELGYEVLCHPADGPAVWDAIWEAGQPHGLKPLGLEALDMLRIESGLIFAGYEFDDQVDPFEAGIGFTVALDHDEDFIGRAALEERKRAPAAHARRPRARRQRGGGSRRPGLHRPPADGRGHERHAQPAAEEVDRALPHGCAGRARSAPRSRWASSTACRSGCRRRSCASRSTTPTRRGLVRERARRAQASPV